MIKIFDEKGNFNKECVRLLVDFSYGLDRIMSSDEVYDMNENELLILGSLLSKMIGDAVSNKISRNRQLDETLGAGISGKQDPWGLST
jgi:hypothetical protein